MKKISIIHIGPPEWFNYKQEIIYGLYHGLRACGYNAKILNNQFDIDALNIIIGSDWLVQNISFDEFISSKFNYLIFEVEKYDKAMLNDNQKFNIENYKKLLRNSEGVITPYLYNCVSLTQSKLISEKKIQYLKWGHYPGMIDPNISRDQQRHIAGTFFGLLKGTRANKASQIKSVLGDSVMFLGPEHPHTFRAAALSCSNYSFSLSYGEKEKFVNPFRLFYLYANGVHVLSDSTSDEDGYLFHATKVDIYDMIEILSRNSLSEVTPLELKEETSLCRNIRNIII